MKSNPSKCSIKEWLTHHNPFSLNVWEQGVVLGYTPPRLGYRTETKDRPVLTPRAKSSRTTTSSHLSSLTAIAPS